VYRKCTLWCTESVHSGNADACDICASSDYRLTNICEAASAVAYKTSNSAVLQTRTDGQNAKLGEACIHVGSAVHAARQCIVIGIGSDSVIRVRRNHCGSLAVAPKCRIDFVRMIAFQPHNASLPPRPTRGIWGALGQFWFKGLLPFPFYSLLSFLPLPPLPSLSHFFAKRNIFRCF